MGIKRTTPSVDVRQELEKLKRPSGVKGEQVLRAKNVEEAFYAVGAGRRNIVINGDMRIAQRGNSSTFSQSNKGYKTVDRFKVWEQGAPTTVFNLTQEEDAPSEFKYSTKFECTTANTDGIPSGVHQYLQYDVEVRDCYGWAWGTSDAKPLTLSFWAKSNVGGAYVVRMETTNGVDLDYFTAPYNLQGTGAWEKIVLHIPPNKISNTRNAVDSAQGFTMKWIIQSSTSYSSGNKLVGWVDSPSTNQLEAGQVADIGANVGNYWQITGVQLEIGKEATPFEHRSYGEELALCQRYYKRFDRTAGNHSNTADAYLPFVWISPNTTDIAATVQHSPPMRANPTITFSGTITITPSMTVGTSFTSDSWNASAGGCKASYIALTGGSGGTTGYARRSYLNASSYLAFDAEI
jgi:hypothetical protein